MCSKYDHHNRGDLYDHLVSTRIVIFDNEEDVHLSSKNHEESGYDSNLVLLMNSYKSRVSYPKRIVSSGLVGKSNHFRPIYPK